MRNIKRRTNGYKVNERFFREWSPEMAYVLGFILTDGNIHGNTISIHQKDRDILVKIGVALSADNPIKRKKNRNPYLHTLSIHRKEMVEDLARLGIGENKSLTVGFPDVPTQYMSHFVRGVIDGDGWVQDRAYVANVTSGSAAFAYGLHDVFNAQGLNGRVSEENGIYRVWVSGKEDIARLGVWLYEAPGELYLERKRERFMLRAS
jgi:DNA-binding transcriptional regulator WhiA